MIKSIGILAVVTVSLVAIAVLQALRLPADAKQCGDHWLKCYSVSQSLYSCKIYSKKKKLIKEQAFMLPYEYWRRDQRELTGRVQKYDGDIIYLDKGMKLLACEVPYHVEMIRSVNGLVWVKYELIKEERNMFYCEVYSTKDGKIISSGAYVIKKYHWDNSRNKTAYEDVKGPVQLFDLNYYGGISISLKNGMALMPAGAIDYSMGPRSGLRVKYDAEGNEIASEEY